MNVNKIQTFIMTLKQRPDRYWSALGYLSALGFSMNRVHTVMGKYWKDFDGYEDIVEAAAADGFPFFMEREVRKKDKAPKRLGYLCNLWSGCRIFRHIAQQTEPYLVLEDDVVPTISYEMFEKRLSALPNETEIAILSMKQQDEDTEMFDENWVYGSYHEAAGAGAANVYTHKGAKMGLKYAAMPGIQTVENIALHYPDEKVFCAANEVIRRNECGGHSDIEGSDPDYYNHRVFSRHKAWENGINLGK